LGVIFTDTKFKQGAGMYRLVGLVALVVMAAVFVACGSSGETSEPTQVQANPTSVSGYSAISSAVADAVNCVGVLAPIEGDLKLFTDPLTSTVSASKPQIQSMCSAMYDTGEPGRKFLSVVLMQFKSDDSSSDQYELMKSAYSDTGDALSELNNADEGLTDVLSVLIDSDGIGRTMVMRQREWLVTVTAGPTMADSPWKVGDMEMIGKGVLERVK
jgi:hypothetical protein